MSEVLIKDCWAEFVFEWFLFSVKESGGDGAAVICCGNPQETSDRFIEWWKRSNPNREFYHPKDEYHGIINYHDSNENFMFIDKKIDLDYHDVSFVIVEDCLSGFENFKILKVKDL